ncbi:MAG: hypothetical protein AB1730_06805 [Myxococcota bacterium]|jgi:hypothetical protein
MRSAAPAVLALWLAACAPCGTFDFATPATTAFYEAVGQPELALPSGGTEACGADFGSQGSWDLTPGRSAILFAPEGGRTAASFGDLFLQVVFPTSAIVEGATLDRAQLGGLAFTGLGTTNRDVALLSAGTVTFHRVGPLLTEDVLNRRQLEVSWELEWSAPPARYAAKGRDVVDFYVEK